MHNVARHAPIYPYALQGQLDQALPALRQTFELDQATGSLDHVTLARTDTDFDPIRSEPAFQALLDEFSTLKSGSLGE